MIDSEVQDEALRKAICRYEVVGRYLAMRPSRGTRRQLLEQLAQERWIGPNGQALEVSAETLRVWVRCYKRYGLEGLKDKPHPKRGIEVLSAEQCALVCKLKEEVPERSIERIIRIAQELGIAPQGTLRRSTVHRVLQSRGLSARKARVADTQDLDRFEADFPNDLWQSDMLKGPWLPDPERPGKMRQAVLYAFLDDHSRMLLHGRFSFPESLPHLELVFRRAIQKWGVPCRAYYDNGKVYRSEHMRQIVASLGVHRLVFTKVRRPQGHGKIEAFNRSVRSQFLSELPASRVHTLSELNEAFNAWVDLEYNRKIHSETQQTPLDRWRVGIDKIRYAEEEAIRQAFLWKEIRSADKTGVFSLLGTRYQVGPTLAKRRFEVRFDPEALHEVEVWVQGQFAERVKPLQILPWRRPKPKDDSVKPSPCEPAKPIADWLGHLVRKARDDSQMPRATQLAQRPAQVRADADSKLIQVLSNYLDEAVFEEPTAREFLHRYGPFDCHVAQLTLEELLSRGERSDRHISFYLEAIRTAHKGRES